MDQISQSDHEQFVQEMIACQGPLYAYLLSLTADPNAAEELLQQTNLVLLRNETEYQPGTNFRAWACGQAFYQMLSDRKTRGRSKLIFDDALLEMIAPVVEQHAEQHNERRLALRHCMQQLADDQRQLIEARYEGGSVKQIAADAGRPAGSVSQSLYRIRQALKDCIKEKLNKEASA